MPPEHRGPTCNVKHSTMAPEHSRMAHELTLDSCWGLRGCILCPPMSRCERAPSGLDENLERARHLLAPIQRCPNSQVPRVFRIVPNGALCSSSFKLFLASHFSIVAGRLPNSDRNKANWWCGQGKGDRPGRRQCSLSSNVIRSISMLHKCLPLALPQVLDPSREVSNVHLAQRRSYFLAMRRACAFCCAKHRAVRLFLILWTRRGNALDFVKDRISLTSRATWRLPGSVDEE
jgi:hypothetical protein